MGRPYWEPQGIGSLLLSGQPLKKVACRASDRNENDLDGQLIVVSALLTTLAERQVTRQLGRKQSEI